MKNRRFFLILSNLFLIVVLIGFSKTLYLSPYFETDDLPIHLVLHGIALTLWFLIAAVQPLLVLKNRVKIHMTLGIAGVTTASVVVILSVITLVVRHRPLIDEFPNLAGPNICSLLMFITCVMLGLKFKLKSAKHKRLMLLASIPLLAPALDRMGRIPVFNEFLEKIFFWFPAPPEVAFAAISFLSLILLVVIYDLITIRKVHSGTLWGLGGIFIFSPLVTFAIFSSGAWSALVNYFN